MSNRPKTSASRNLRCQRCGRRNRPIGLHTFTAADSSQEKAALETLICDPCAREVLSSLSEKHAMQHSPGLHGHIRRQANAAERPEPEPPEQTGDQD